MLETLAGSRQLTGLPRRERRVGSVSSGSGTAGGGDDGAAGLSGTERDD